MATTAEQFDGADARMSWADEKVEEREAVTPKKEDSKQASTRIPLKQLLGLPSPARNTLALPGVSQRSAAPCKPPAYAPVMLSAPSMPPPPPSMPAAYPGAQVSWESSPSAATGFPQQAMGSYRERLRAGGRGAFQRTMNAGLMPKAMKEQSPMANGAMPQWPEVPNGMVVQYAGTSDCEQMWNGAGQIQGNDCWSMPSPHMPQSFPYMQQAPQFQQPMLPQQAMQMAPMHAEQMPQMQAVPMHHMPQMQVQPVQSEVLATSGDATPTMPQASQDDGDDDLMALKLRAAAEMSQCYED